MRFQGDNPAATLLDKVSRVDRLFGFLDPHRYRYFTYYPAWVMLPEHRTETIGSPNEKCDQVGLYIHVPLCASRCRDCIYHSFHAGENGDASPFTGRGPGAPQVTSAWFDEYVECIKKHLRLYADDQFSPDQVGAIFIGGGTPSLLSPKQLERLLRVVADWLAGGSGRRIRDSRVEEITIEWHVGSFSEDDWKEKLDLMIDQAGQRLRVNLGLQTFDEDLARFIRGCEGGRGPDGYATGPGYGARAVEACRRLLGSSVSQVNIDFMYGYLDDLPHKEERPSRVTRDLDQLNDLASQLRRDGAKRCMPETITFHQVWHGVDRRYYGARSRHDGREIDDVYDALGLRLMVHESLTQRLGYVPEIGSIYRRPDRSATQNIYLRDYCFGGRDVIAVGPGAYGYARHYAFLLMDRLKDYRESVMPTSLSRPRHPVRAGMYLGESEASFRQALLRLKKYHAKVDRKLLMDYLGTGADVLTQLSDAALLEEVASTPGAEQVGLTESGFLVVDEIASLLQANPSNKARLLCGFATKADDAVIPVFNQSEEASVKTEDAERCLTETNAYLDEFLRQVLPVGETATNDQPAYLCGIAAVQTRAVVPPGTPAPPLYAAPVYGSTARTVRGWRASEWHPHFVSFFQECMADSPGVVLSNFQLFFAKTDEYENRPEASELRLKESTFHNLPPMIVVGKDAAALGKDYGAIDAHDLIALLQDIIYKEMERPTAGDETDAGKVVEAIRAFWREGRSECDRTRIGHQIGALRVQLGAYLARFAEQLVRWRGGYRSGQGRFLQSLRKDATSLSWDQLGKCLAVLQVYASLIPPLESDAGCSSTVWILHVPFLAYTPEAQGGVVAFFQGKAPPPGEAMLTLAGSVNTIVGRYAARDSVFYARRSERLAEQHKRQSEEERLRADLSASFSHQYVKQALAMRTSAEDLCSSAQPLTEADDLAAIRSVGESIVAEANTLRALSDIYHREMECFAEVAKGTFRPGDVALRTRKEDRHGVLRLLVPVLRGFYEALVAGSAGELKSHWNKVFPARLDAFKALKKLRGGSGPSELREDYIREMEGISDPVIRWLPSVEDWAAARLWPFEQNTKVGHGIGYDQMFQSMFEKVFFECWFNVFRHWYDALNSGRWLDLRERFIDLRISEADTEEVVISISSRAYVPTTAAQMTDDDWVRFLKRGGKRVKPTRPGVTGGIGGWGLYGCSILADLLNSTNDSGLSRNGCSFEVIYDFPRSLAATTRQPFMFTHRCEFHVNRVYFVQENAL